MADDLVENFEIGEEFMPPVERPNEVNSSADEDEDDKDNDNEVKTESIKRKNTTTKTTTSKRKRKNITEILELKKNEMSKASFATREFKKILTDYAQKKLSGVEKNELNLGTSSEEMAARLGKMMLKRKKTHRLDVGVQFKKKFAKKLRSREKSSDDDRRSPFIVVLAQSAVRCIELHKQLSCAQPTLFKSLAWLYAFAKHKKLAEQVSFINDKFERDAAYTLDVVYATPQRFKQLVDAACLSTRSIRYVFIDYSFRDVKLKRIVDHNEIRGDLCDLVFKSFLPLNRHDRISLKFYLA